MNYFIIQDWQNTHGNHAGMVHLCKKIKEKDSNNVKLFIIPNIKRIREIQADFGGIK